jgi:hypothetical protein
MIMTEAKLFELSIAEAGRKLRDGSITSIALTEDALARIIAIDPALNSFITVTADRARADAAAADADFAKGIDNGPMQGVPYALKDIYDTAGIRSTCHSKLRADDVPAADSVVETKFKAQGGVLLGSSPPMNSRSAARASICRFRRRAIPGTASIFRAAPPPARVRRSPPGWCAWQWDRTPAARSAAPPLIAAQSA